MQDLCRSMVSLQDLKTTLNHRMQPLCLLPSEPSSTLQAETFRRADAFSPQELYSSNSYATVSLFQVLLYLPGYERYGAPLRLLVVRTCPL